MRESTTARQQDWKRSFDCFIVALILAKEFILDFLGLGFYVNLAICCLIIVRITYIQWRIPGFVYIAVAVLPFLTFLAIMMDGSVEAAITNLARLAQVALYALYFLFLKISEPDRLRMMFEKGFSLFNAILIVNMVAMVIQYNFPGTLIAASETPQLSGPDAISGLFGSASTHSVALYTTFVVVYDIAMVRRNSADKRISVLYIFVLSVCSLYIATLNDNKALFFFLPLGLFFYWLIYISFHYRTSGVKTILLISTSLCIALFSYWGIPAVRSFVDDHIMRSVNMIANAWDLGAYVNGSDERFQAVPFALSLPTTWGLGDGLGQADLYQEGYRGFNHFGQSDFCSIVILGGMWLYLFILFFYTRVFSFSSQAKLRKRMLISGTLFLLLVSSSIFTQVFTQVRIAIPLLLLNYALYMHWQCLVDEAEEGLRRTDPLIESEPPIADTSQDEKPRQSFKQRPPCKNLSKAPQR